MKQRSEEKPKAILDVSLELFGTVGYETTKMPMIAEGAKVATGTIYRYYESKQAILNELFQNSIRTLLASLESGYDFNASTKNQYDRIFDGAIKFVKHNSGYVTFINKNIFNSDLNEKSITLRNELISFISEFIVLGQKRKVLKPIAPHIIMGMMYSALVFFVDFLQKIGHEKHKISVSETLEELRIVNWDAFASLD